MLQVSYGLEFECVSNEHQGDRSLKDHQLERDTGAVSAPTYDAELCLCSGAGLVVLQGIHKFCVPTGSSALYAHVNSHVGFRKRHLSLQRRGVSGGHFPVQNLPGEAKGVMSPGMQKQGTKELAGRGRHARQGLKTSPGSQVG